MKICQNCHNPVNDDVKFCHTCGSSLEGQINSLSPNNLSQTQIFQQNSYNQAPSPNPYYQQQPGYIYQPNYSRGIQKPAVITLISIYEITVGIFLILGGVLFLFLLDFVVQFNGSLSSTPNGEEDLVIGIIIIAFGFFGILTAIAFLKWKQNGLVFSYIFLIITGIAFILYIVPPLISLAFIIYVNTSKSFKSTFNYMKKRS